MDSPCVHDISSASPVDPLYLHNVSSPSPVDLPVAVAYAHRYYRRYGIGISIFYFSICTLCCVNVLHMFALSATLSAIFVQPFYLILSYPISTLPEHLHSTFPSHAKLPENTLTKKKTFLFPL